MTTERPARGLAFAAWALALALALCPNASALAAAQGSGAAPATARIVTEEAEPFNMTVDGHVTGLCTEVVEAVLQQIGMTSRIEVMPWARAYDLALSSPNVLIYSIVRTARREHLFKWVGVIARSDWYLYSLRDHPVWLRSLDEAKAHQIGTVNEDAGEQYLVAQGFVIGRNLQSSSKSDFIEDQMRVGRVDLWVSDEVGMNYTLSRSGKDPDKVVLRSLPLPDLGGDGFYMAFGATTPDAMVERFRSGLEAIKKNGTYDQLRNKWL